MFWFVHDQGFLLVVSRVSIGLPIRFYCKKMKKFSFLQKWYSGQSVTISKLAHKYRVVEISFVIVSTFANSSEPTNIYFQRCCYTRLELVVPLSECHQRFFPWLFSTFLQDGQSKCIICAAALFVWLLNSFVFFELALSRGMDETFCVIGCLLKFVLIGCLRDYFGTLC